MELKDKKVVIIGAGKSGISACRLLTEEGADITLYDSNEKLDTENMDVSSSEIREWVRSGHPVRYYLRSSVEHYIRENGIYLN